jgi:hypothetical protein
MVAISFGHSLNTERVHGQVYHYKSLTLSDIYHLASKLIYNRHNLSKFYVNNRKNYVRIDID